MKWNESLSVNVIEIDKQHQHLIGVVNDLHDAMGKRKGKEVLGKTFNSLIRYAEDHFITEEKYFDQFGYPDADRHKNEHTKFVIKLAEFKVRFDGGEQSLIIDLMSFLVDWLHNHLQIFDMEYRPFFNTHGLK
jgi:hemerythrin